MNLDELKAYGIAEQILKVIENGFTFDEETGEVFFTTDDLDALNIAFKDKMESLAGIYQMYCDKASSIKIRSKDIAEKGKRFEKKAENLKRYINLLMTTMGKTKLDAGEKTLSYRKSTSSEIYDEKKLIEWIESSDENKEKYLNYKKPEISKKALVDAIKSGEDIPGFRIVEKNNLQIK